MKQKLCFFLTMALAANMALAAAPKPSASEPDTAKKYETRVVFPNAWIGLRGGVNVSDMDYTHQALDRYAHTNMYRPMGGLFFHFQLGKSHLALRPEVTYIERADSLSWLDVNYSFKARYVDFRLPFLLNFGGPKRTVSPYLMVAPEFCWFLRDNLGFGAKVGYGRTMLDAASGSIDFGSISLGVKDFYTISQDVSLTAFMRYYLPIADSERIAMYVDAGLQGVWGHSKESDAHTGAIVGTWQDKWKAGLVVNPGIMAYFSKHVAVFASLGMAGLCYGRVSQVHNQVDSGSRGSFTMSYMLDLTSLNIGLDFYIGKK